MKIYSPLYGLKAESVSKANKKLNFKIVSVLLFLFCQKTEAQNFSADKEIQPKHFLKFGYGLVQTFTLFNSFNGPDNIAEYDVQYSSITGPLYFKYEYNANYNLTAGFSFSYESNKWDTLGVNNGFYSYGGLLKYSSYSFLFRFNYLIVPDKKIQPYIGIGFGFKNLQEDYYTYETTTYYSNNNYYPIYTYREYTGKVTRLGGEFTLGLNVLLKKGFGLYGEFGIAKSLSRQELSNASEKTFLK